jgi:hypothetical protein
METTEEVSSDGIEKRVERRKSRRSAPCASEKRRKDWGKRLANLWGRKKSTKKAHAGRGPETKWEIPDHIVLISAHFEIQASHSFFPIGFLLRCRVP